MQVTTITCDRCGVIIAAGLVRFIITSIDKKPESVELCGDCASAFRAWLKAGETVIPWDQAKTEDLLRQIDDAARGE